jgi:Peptidase A4 family
MLKMSDEELLKHIVCYDAPPADFDPTTAEARILRKHGIPRRPDADKEPRLREIWDRFFASKPTFIKAEVAVDHRWSKRKRPVMDSVDFGVGGWAGAYVPVSEFGYYPYKPVHMVYGEWSIPTVTPIPKAPPLSQDVGFWVGIDGVGNGQVLQAGNWAQVFGSKVKYSMWTEWWPLGPISVKNFPIKAGEYMKVVVCVPFKPNHGTCCMLNTKTNRATSIGIKDPPKTTSIGATAEWIVEQASSVLPKFSTVVFSNVSAGTEDHDFNASGGTIFEITDSAGKNQTAASIPSHTSVQVKWLRSS